MQFQTLGHTPVPDSSDLSASSPVLERYRAVRAATLALTAPLSPEDLMVQSCAEASPAKWHLAHTTWFFETFVLREFLPAYRDFHPDFHWLFNSYYNSLGDMPAKSLRASFSRPPLADILAYRAHVDGHIAQLLETAPNPEAARRITLGLHHEQQHQELIATDIKHALFSNPLHPAYADPAPAPATDAIAPPLDWVAFTPGLTQIGFAPKPADPTDFSFDNETPRHSVFIAPFSLATRLVTCAEYLAFMDDNGYARPELWLSEGWTTQREAGWQAPLYWQRDPETRSGWRIFTLHGWQPLDSGDLSETPVCHLSFFEAAAYAQWASRRDPGCRLPTEFEWEYAASQASVQPTNLLESANLHPTRASSRPGLQQLYGDVWEWTASAYLGYPGYRALPGALGEYNGKFMSSQMVLRGGSCVTPATHIRATYRNFFSPGTRWQFAGLRLARDPA
jgi:ergothioneine biosynthesis protein EgtB